MGEINQMQSKLRRWTKLKIVKYLADLTEVSRFGICKSVNLEECHGKLIELPLKLQSAVVLVES